MAAARRIVRRPRPVAVQRRGACSRPGRCDDRGELRAGLATRLRDARVRRTAPGRRRSARSRRVGTSWAVVRVDNAMLAALGEIPCAPCPGLSPTWAAVRSAASPAIRESAARRMARPDRAGGVITRGRLARPRAPRGRRRTEIDQIAAMPTPAVGRPRAIPPSAKSAEVVESRPHAPRTLVWIRAALRDVPHQRAESSWRDDVGDVAREVVAAPPSRPTSAAAARPRVTRHRSWHDRRRLQRAPIGTFGRATPSETSRSPRAPVARVRVGELGFFDDRPGRPSSRAMAAAVCA